MSKPLQTINYDYAVWDRTYSYMKSNSATAKRYYEKHEFPNDTFKSLKVDGVFIFNRKNQPVFTKGFNHRSDTPLSFDLMDFNKYPQNIALSPQTKQTFPPKNSPIDNPDNVPSTDGIIATRYGPAIYSSTSILKSDRSGAQLGYLVFIRLIDKSFISELSQYTAAGVEIADIESTDTYLPTLGSNIKLAKLSPTSERLIKNVDGKPLFKLVLYHTNTQAPPLLAPNVFILLAEMSMLLILAYSLYSYFLVTPVRKLAIDIQDMDRSREIKKLRYHYPITELIKVATHFNALMGTIQEQTKQLNEQAYIDKLTNIPNRRSFEQRLETYCQLLARQQIGFTLIIADVDHFKQYNDTLGHLAGDAALIKVAQTLTQQFYRAEDMCARFGGEEFIMLFRDIPDEPLQAKLDAMLLSFKDLALPHPSSDTAPYVTISLGACKVDPIEDYQFKNNSNVIGRQVSLLADKALYQAKDAGRNQYRKVSIRLDRIEECESSNPSDQP
ncbi:diguanylate cyclase [Shewanella sp. 10N.261.52.F9]|uniref:sensor domain-containing diguanylate cyclase n=1 Tax=Shewanella sp. 10N.261.52.F9 TaxID=3229684 RepID=UPI003550728C